MQTAHLTKPAFLIFSMFLLLQSSSFSQENKFKGFMIDIQGDTVFGSFPSYRQWNLNPGKVTFKAAGDQNHILLQPASCLAFSIDGFETFVSYHGTRMLNPLQLQQNPNPDVSDKFDNVHVFLRQIGVGGSYRFFILKDRQRINMFYVNGDGQPNELLQKTAMIDKHFWQSFTYREQLKSIFPAKSSAIDHVLYNEESLVTLLGRQKKSLPVVARLNKQQAGMFVVAGISINSLSFSPNKSLDFTNKDYPTRVVPVIAAGYLVPFRRNFSRFYYLPQVKISSMKHTGVTSYSENYMTSSTFKASPVISMGFHFGYNIIDRPGLRLSIAPGGGLSFFVKNEQVDAYRVGVGSPVKSTTGLMHLRHQLDVQAMLDIQNKFLVWSAYDLPTSFTSYLTTKDRFSSLQLGVGYKFR